MTEFVFEGSNHTSVHEPKEDEDKTKEEDQGHSDPKRSQGNRDEINNWIGVMDYSNGLSELISRISSLLIREYPLVHGLVHGSFALFSERGQRRPKR